MQPLTKIFCSIFAIGLIGTNSAYGTSILLSSSNGIADYGYGYSQWTSFTSELDSASGNGVTVVADYNDLSQLLAADALFLDQRWTSGSLNANELSNLAAFISTGKKIVLMGENSFWTNWNNQILGLVGSSHAGDFNGITNTLISHELTAGVSSVSLGTSGLAVSGGIALFDQNWATLWGTNQNVLTILDVNALSDSYWYIADNGVFARNVATWLSSSSTVPDDGSTVALLGLALIALGALRRQKVSS